MESPILIFIMGCLVVLAFLLLREIFCWYWKINSLVKSQERICGLLESISREQGRLILALESSLESKVINAPESRESPLEPSTAEP